MLEGTGEVLIGKDTVAIGPGDWVTFPVGPDSAHRVTNTGDGPLRYLCLSTMHSVDVVGYPDSGKIAALGTAPGKSWMEPAWIRGVYQEDSKVDYYDGEEID